MCHPAKLNKFFVRLEYNNRIRAIWHDHKPNYSTPVWQDDVLFSRFVTTPHQKYVLQCQEYGIDPLPEYLGVPNLGDFEYPQSHPELRFYPGCSGFDARTEDSEQSSNVDFASAYGSRSSSFATSSEEPSTSCAVPTPDPKPCTSRNLLGRLCSSGVQQEEGNVSADYMSGREI